MTPLRTLPEGAYIQPIGASLVIVHPDLYPEFVDPPDGQELVAVVRNDRIVLYLETANIA